MVVSARSAQGHNRGCFAALVVALVVVPAVVRATQRLDGGPTPCSMRLNRGFAAPGAKVRLTPPRDATIQTAAIDHEPTLPPIAATSTPVEWIPDSAPDPFFETRRGPPNGILS
jgi:hypothetical protein